MTSYEKEIADQLEAQQLYIRALVAKVVEIKTMKRNPQVTDLEVGAEIGYLEKMLKDFERDCESMYHDIYSILNTEPTPMVATGEYVREQIKRNEQ